MDFDYAEASALLWRSQWKGMALALLALGILTLVILRLFEKLINRPISRLKTAMARVQGGDFAKSQGRLAYFFSPYSMNPFSLPSKVSVFLISHDQRIRTFHPKSPKAKRFL